MARCGSLARSGLPDADRPPETTQLLLSVFDGRNCLDHRALHAIGFNVYPIGKRPLIRL